MAPTKKPDAEKRNAEREAALTFVRMAKEKGLDLTGPDGLLKQFTKSVLETALDEEMTEHLGRAKHKKSKDGRAANTRNGTTAKTVVTDSVGPVGIEVPRDRDGSFEPVVVRKRQRRLPGVDEVVLSLYARGLTTGEISAHFQEIYGADVSRETVSRITERVMAEKDEWCSRPLDRVYAAVFIDATSESTRDRESVTAPLSFPATSPAIGFTASVTMIVSFQSDDPIHKQLDTLVICTTNAIESLNARFKRSIRARGHFPDEQAALKCMYLTVRSLDPTGKGRIRWSARWKPALNAFAITFADRWPSEGTQQ